MFRLSLRKRQFLNLINFCNYNISASILSALDHINLMCYDFHGAWEPFTGHNAPLYVNPNLDVGDNATWNSVSYFRGF
jgi:GH18 family chitinase